MTPGPKSRSPAPLPRATGCARRRNLASWRGSGPVLAPTRDFPPHLARSGQEPHRKITERAETPPGITSREAPPTTILPAGLPVALPSPPSPQSSAHALHGPHATPQISLHRPPLPPRSARDPAVARAKQPAPASPGPAGCIWPLSELRPLLLPPMRWCCPPAVPEWEGKWWCRPPGNSE